LAGILMAVPGWRVPAYSAFLFIITSLPIPGMVKKFFASL